MAVKPIPEGFHTLTPYLHVKGARKLIDFLKQAFGGEEFVRMRMTRQDGTIGHAQVKIGDSMIEMSDVQGESGPVPCAIHVYVNDVDRVYEDALRVGGASLYEPVDQGYGDREAGVKDQFGNSWYIATHIKDV